MYFVVTDILLKDMGVLNRSATGDTDRKEFMKTWIFHAGSS